VTGSRIRADGMTAPVPLTVVNAEEIETLSPGALITGVSQLPQFYGNQTPNSGNFFVRSGYGSLNLRGLGVNRTLTLLNGRRMPSTSAFGGVDINLFPEAMRNDHGLVPVYYEVAAVIVALFHTRLWRG